MDDKTKNFVDRAIMIHGAKYDYSDVVYVNAKTKVKIKCGVHGVFEQTPDLHIGKFRCGCPLCAGNVKSTMDEFVKKARIVHGDLYDYSDVVYVNNHTQVSIRCRIHGIFNQTPSNHLMGKGCSKCANNERFTTLKFVEQAVIVHGDTYDYSMVDYHGNRQAVDIICRTHGVFCQIPYVHLSGGGCPACGKLKRVANRDSKAAYEKTVESCMSRYGVCNPMAVPEIRERQIKAVRSDVVNDKRIATKRRNNSFNTSSCELRLKNMLISVFGDDDLYMNYKSDVYPFRCDFYIKSRNMYIELNAHWSHGNHWYTELDSDIISDWKCRSKFYRNAAVTFSIRDVRKRDFARQNNLNYIVFWKSDLSDAISWFDAGCPDGTDWLKEYSWKTE